MSGPRSARRPPRLVYKTLSVTFLTVFVLLAVVFIVVTVSVRRQVRQSVAANLESSQRMFAALETRRQRELLSQAGTLAENPTLKAALDTYQSESRTGRDAVQAQLLATIDSELRKVAARIEVDAIVLVDMRRLGALLHDIGKIGVPDDVLRKPGGLTDAEFDIIKQHPVLGARILRAVPFLAPHIPIVELHHERPDGRGYPKGLRGDDIPLAARIVHVADACEAMASARAYRGARPSGAALRELWRCAGTEFHAEIVGALATALPGVTSETASLEHV